MDVLLPIAPIVVLIVLMTKKKSLPSLVALPLTAIHQLPARRSLSLIVTRQGAAVGVLRVVDGFEKT